VAFTYLYSGAMLLLCSFFLNLPESLQDMAVEAFATLLVGGTVYLHMVLFGINPVLVLLPTFVAILLVHFSVQSGKGHARVALARASTEFTVPSSSSLGLLRNDEGERASSAPALDFHPILLTTPHTLISAPPSRESSAHGFSVNGDDEENLSDSGSVSSSTKGRRASMRRLVRRWSSGRINAGNSDDLEAAKDEDNNSDGEDPPHTRLAPILPLTLEQQLRREAREKFMEEHKESMKITSQNLAHHSAKIKIVTRSAGKKLSMARAFQSPMPLLNGGAATASSSPSTSAKLGASIESIPEEEVRREATTHASSFILSRRSPSFRQPFSPSPLAPARGEEAVEEEVEEEVPVLRTPQSRKIPFSLREEQEDDEDEEVEDQHALSDGNIGASRKPFA